ncbi:ENHANCER OF AG-4 protein 2-like isoform X1 [Malania oleifera]|uniref:ENHANCER OF AG-4 protein 2-like isoform X1 n=1 Tax=Malania oleifera TaxID=397392 RepID=UPI0025AEAA57|nr:ENHANCER OF AG-4 protein 2-like isoform X1 [Malania oleifera]
MAPWRKRGANKAKAKTQLSLGDLILAKVKGFPAWPAKISRPEDWDRTPDPKKYFVQFFGTQEIAFIAPAEIQEFTGEVKNKLSARCQGKTVKPFAKAVKEICEAFENLQQKKLGELRVDTNGSAIGCQAPSVDGLDDDGVELDLKDGVGVTGPNEELELEGLTNGGSRLEYTSHGEGKKDGQDVKPSISCNKNNTSSQVATTKKKNKAFNEGLRLPKEAVSASSPATLSCMKEEFLAIKRKIL